MPLAFKRSYNPLINTDVSDGFDGKLHVLQATACRDVPGSVLVAFSKGDGKWYGHHKNSATTLDEFEARFKED